jgi:hypothetical protein
MAITDIVVTGYVFQDDGDALAGATVELLETGTSTVEATYNSGTGTTAAGLWTFTETSLDTTYDVKITHGTSVRRSRMWADEITLKGVDASYMKIRGADTAAAPLYFIADKGDNNIDIWTVQAADGGAFTFESFASGSTVAQLTITPHATVASSSVTFPGILDVNGSVDWDVTLVQVDSSGDINLVSTNDAADAIYLRENAGTSGTIKIHADQGTSESSIQLLSDAGGVDINAATGKDVDIAGGTVNLTSSDDAASAIYLRANAGTSETIKIHADQGTGAASISAVSDAGGITLDAGLDIVLSADGGNITMDDGTSTIFDFDVDGTTLTIHDDQDTGDTAVITMAQHGALSIVTTDDDAAAANIQITADGTAELAGTTVTLDSAADIELEATNDINIPADVGLTFGDDGEKIEGDGTNLVVESSGTLDMNSGGVLTLDSGAAINIEPASGSAVLIDGTISIDAESIFATDIKIGEDDETKIDFETADEIHFYAGNENQLTLTDGALTPSSNAIVDLGTDALEFKDAYFDGTLEADAITIGGTNIVTGSLITTLGTISAGTWQGTAIASAYLDADTAHLSTAQTFSGAKTFSAAATFDDDITLSADSKSIVIPKGHIQLENDPSAPSAPSAGYVRIYSDTTYDGIAIAHSAGTSFLNHQKLVLGAGLTGDAGILFNGDGTDTYIGFDGGTNDLMIGTGTTIGSNSFMTFSDTFGNIGIGHTPTSGNFGIQYEDDITGSNDQQTMGHVGIGIGGGHSMNTQNDAVEYSRAGTLDVNRPVLYINGSDTVADAFTLRVANEPQAGTRAWALWVDAGTSRFDGDIGNNTYRIPKIWTTNQDTTNAENVSSWSQVKENINTYTEDALAILRKISVVSFSHVTDLDPSGRIKLGLLADSIDEPLAAPMGEYEFGYGIGPRIDMMGLAALAVRSIQELETRLLALEGGK